MNEEILCRLAREHRMFGRMLTSIDTGNFARAVLALATSPSPAVAEPAHVAKEAQGAVALCACKDRPARDCDEEWGPNCDLGNNEAHTRRAPPGSGVAVDAALGISRTPPAPASPAEPSERPGPSGDTPSDFQEGQWWLKKLDDVAACGTDDFKRAVAVVRNMMRTMHAQVANPNPNTPAPVAVTRERGDTERLDWIETRRVSLIPEFEGPWDATVYDDEGEPKFSACGKSPRAAIDAAIAGSPAGAEGAGS